MSDLFFATPWWVPIFIISVGIVVFISGNKRQQARVRQTGIGIALLAVLLMLVSYLVETDKEKVDRHMHELIADVEKRDWEKMKSLLSPQISLGNINGAVYPNRDALLKGAADAVDLYHLTSVIITSMETKQTQTVITVDMNVMTEQDATMGRPVPSSWQFQWDQAGKDWLLSQITCVSVGNENVNRIGSLFPK